MNNYGSLAALIYVTQSEESSVLRMYNWKTLIIDGDVQIYYEATTAKGEKIYAARTDEMGMTAAATLTMKLIDHFKPKYVIMPGIAAGASNDESSDSQQYGDVILADSIWNYSNGKYVPKDQGEIVFGEIGFLPRPTIIRIDPELRDIFKKAVLSDKNECYVHIGPLASGSKVVANKNILDSFVIGQFEDTQGLEMEAYGVAYAATHAVSPRPKPIIAKSICDFADNRKSDLYQKFAAYTSCEFVKMMLEYLL